MTTTLEDANKAMRAAVKHRLDNTDPSDEKLIGYKLDQGDPEPTPCCEGRPMRAPRHPSSDAFVALLEEMQRLHESKSADYGSEEDPLANVRSGADFVNIEPWRGCMVRIADKVQRLRTYCRTGRLVHEGVRDTLLDLSAYSLLAIVLFDEGNGGS
jgi:hypothetical protein